MQLLFVAADKLRPTCSSWVGCFTRKCLRFQERFWKKIPCDTLKVISKTTAESWSFRGICVNEITKWPLTFSFLFSLPHSHSQTKAQVPEENTRPLNPPQPGTVMYYLIYQSLIHLTYQYPPFVILMIQVGVLRERNHIALIFNIFIFSSSSSARKTQKTHDDPKNSEEESKQEKDHHYGLDCGGDTGHSGSGCFL